MLERAKDMRLTANHAPSDYASEFEVYQCAADDW
jgi:hypothetical protein